ncbi:hypothetical protein OG500_25915 [Kitasatospora sp. NBC_01250]|uniref:hypothetical protein n=1 Tax=unclassified Kitasatospora TaxID=2633591 RepID=UPI002E11BEAA|nr:MULTISPECIES: hypothetical protein [unclassified Kitasatospora]WSJ69531.1 hypothetical protein OG294_27465 [Kitasatospora sp. NBC_01302]
MVTAHKLAGELPAQRVEEAKGRAATLLLAFRHGNQVAFDTALDRLLDDQAEREVVTLLAWVAAEAVRKAYAPEVGDRVLRSLARRAPQGEIGVLVDEESADAARLIEAVRGGQVAAVRALVAATPDTTFLLGGLLQAVAMMLPLLPEDEVDEVLAELRLRQSPVPAAV